MQPPPRSRWGVPINFPAGQRSGGGRGPSGRAPVSPRGLNRPSLSLQVPKTSSGQVSPLAPLNQVARLSGVASYDFSGSLICIYFSREMSRSGWMH